MLYLFWFYFRSVDNIIIVKFTSIFLKIFIDDIFLVKTGIPVYHVYRQIFLPYFLLLINFKKVFFQTSSDIHILGLNVLNIVCFVVFDVEVALGNAKLAFSRATRG